MRSEEHDYIGSAVSVLAKDLPLRSIAFRNSRFFARLSTSRDSMSIAMQKRLAGIVDMPQLCFCTIESITGLPYRCVCVYTNTFLC